MNSRDFCQLDPILIDSSTIIQGRLYFLPSDSINCDRNRYFIFNTDEELIYQKFNYDFGPLNLGCIYKFCLKLNNYLESFPKNKIIVYNCSVNQRRRVNAAFLIGAFMMIYMGFEPEEIYSQLLAPTYIEFVKYRDVSSNPPGYTISLLDCLHGLSKAMKNNFFDFNTFNLHDYVYYEQVDNGDMNWIIPGKMLAFCGPCDLDVNKMDYIQHSPEFYVPIFKKFKIQTIVRLNSKAYQSKKFTDQNFHHYDLIFPDGTTPSDKIVLKFLEISDINDGALAVHCKAGLGRTGTLIAAFIMSHYKFKANEAIAWIRVCRSGSIIGPQQSWLAEKQNWLWSLYETENQFQYSLRSRSAFRSSDRFSNVLNDDDRKFSEPLPVIKGKNFIQTLHPPKKIDKISTSDNIGLSNLHTSQENLTQGDELNQRKMYRENMRKSSYSRSSLNENEIPKDGMTLRSGFQKIASSRSSISYKRKKKNSYDLSLNNSLPIYSSMTNRPFFSKSAENIAQLVENRKESMKYLPKNSSNYSSLNGNQKRVDLRKQPCVRKIETRKQNMLMNPKGIQISPPTPKPKSQIIESNQSLKDLPSLTEESNKGYVKQPKTRHLKRKI